MTPEDMQGLALLMLFIGAFGFIHTMQKIKMEKEEGALRDNGIPKCPPHRGATHSWVEYKDEEGYYRLICSKCSKRPGEM